MYVVCMRYLTFQHDHQVYTIQPQNLHYTPTHFILHYSILSIRTEITLKMNMNKITLRILNCQVLNNKQNTCVLTADPIYIYRYLIFLMHLKKNQKFTVLGR